MPIKIRLIAINAITGLTLLLMLCLGAQNLNNRQELKLGIGTTAPLPSGFLIGISIVLGVVGGGSAASLLINRPRS